MHFIADRRRADIEDAAKDAGKAQGYSPGWEIDRPVATIYARRLGLPGRISGAGVGARKATWHLWPWSKSIRAITPAPVGEGDASISVLRASPMPPLRCSRLVSYKCAICRLCLL
jgi:hypothetical protein